MLCVREVGRLVIQAQVGVRVDVQERVLFGAKIWAAQLIWSDKSVAWLI